jgi:hypothetical protein
MQRLLGIAIVLLGVVGCGGEATLVVRNNTSSYVSGDVDGSSFGVVAGGETQRVVDVGGFMSSTSKVDLSVRYHANSSGFSSVIETKREKVELKANEILTYEAYFSPSLQRNDLRLLGRENTGGILAP